MPEICYQIDSSKRLRDIGWNRSELQERHHIIHLVMELSHLEMGGRGRELHATQTEVV